MSESYHTRECDHFTYTDTPGHTYVCVHSQTDTNLLKSETELDELPVPDIAGVLQCVASVLQRVASVLQHAASVLQVCCRCVASVLQVCCRCVAGVLQVYNKCITVSCSLLQSVLVCGSVLTMKKPTSE